MSAGAPERIAFVFPGQGSQGVGMGKAWALGAEAARRVFEEADRVLGLPLSALCWEGPEEALRLTANTQPAILAVSVAILRAAGDRLPQPALLAGHSLGEYSALVAAGVLDFADALRLVRRRGELMQQAVPDGQGAMAAVLGLAGEQVAAVAERAAGGQVCVAANFNSPKQTVIAGHREAVERAVEMARESGARRAVLLSVSAPFHSPLMAPARAGLEPRLGEVSFGDPRVPVVSNVDARPVTRGDEARRALVRQVDHPVRWVESVRWMVEREGVSLFVEIGPGAVLSGLIRQIAPQARTMRLAEPQDLEELERAAGGEG